MKDDFGDRIKNYEQLYSIQILPKLPVIIRIDGKGFSKLTKALHCKKPFDQRFGSIMMETAQHLLLEIQGCVLAYIQSDEISLVLRNDQSLETEPWFSNKIQKWSASLPVWLQQNLTH